MTGKPGQSSVVYLREAHQRSVSDWIRQLLPPGWQFRQQNAAIPALNKRLPVWSVNDQWHRALNALLAGQQLYGHMDWNRKILTVTTSATPPVDVTAPQGSQKAADTPRNPFRGSTATPAGPTPAQEVHQGEDVIGEARRVGVVLLDPQVGFVVQQAVEHVG